MGYTEILQMVNSDPSVSLNEKIEYVGGVIPRNIVTKTVSCSRDSSSTILDITGSGMIIGISAHGGYYDYNSNGSHTYYKSQVVITAYIDQGESSEKTVILKSPNAASSAAFSVDMFAVGSSVDLTQSNVNMSEANYIANDVLMFKHSLKVTYSASGGAIWSLQQCSGSITYALKE